ncbi:MAG: response regulator transcription factor, partial [Acetatifactor sp.]|nr:response regulator transcription factor [Acetatifactor sp.]
LDGLSAGMRIREKQTIPIIVLRAKSEDTDKILGLSMGADDYVAKPFNPQELAARVKSQLRRYTLLGDIHAGNRADEIKNGRLLYRTDERVLYADGEAVRLTATETKIIDLLMRNLGRVFPAEEIYRRVWEEDAFASENTVMVHIRRIREKLELNPKEPEYLKVVWGIGYKMEKQEKCN